MEEYYPLWCKGVVSTINHRINNTSSRACNLSNVVVYCNRIIEAAGSIAMQDLPAAKSLDIGESLMEVVFQEVFVFCSPHT